MAALDRSYDRRPIHVLIVEDDPLLRFFLADELRFACMTVVESASADEALRYMGTDAPVDLVFTDIQMPGTMDGLELAAILGRTDPHLPVIITSGAVTPVKPPAIGAFIAKPYRMPDATDLVFKTLGVNRQDRQA